MDLISGNCPRLFQTSAGEKVGDHAKEWSMRACQGQDACLKHWMNWNRSEKCGFVIKLHNFTSCVLLIGDNSHLMVKPQTDSLKKKKLICLWLPLTRLTTFHRNLWSGDGHYELAVQGSLWNGQGLVTEHLAILHMETLCPREGMGLVQSYPAMKSQGSIHPG